MKQKIGDFESGQVVLVTAGASGIGRCIAETFQAHGCRVHVCDVNPAAVDAFLAANPAATASLADVSDPQQVESLFSDFANHYDHLDILVNNAGIAGPTAAVEDIAVADWDRTVAVDLNGQFYVTRLAVPLIKKVGGGSIINLSSNAGLFGCPLRSPYVAAKWAVIGLTKTWAMELGTSNIRVNALCPGSVNGDRIVNVIKRDAEERGMSAESIREVYARQSSMRLFVDAQDIANMALFLSSNLGASISGQAIGVDGHTEGLSNWLG
ncbi:MAG: SDR family oxidoreductase [Gammaproteobacteria bacterium]|jgi:NAD(P)-dependent dehydrogenase (short-subunit alcohol dehydrogenase family)|nr:SDR family oxidoreductase [Gammaproteobacteria bacterium]